MIRRFRHRMQCMTAIVLTIVCVGMAAAVNGMYRMTQVNQIEEALSILTQEQKTEQNEGTDKTRWKLGRDGLPEYPADSVVRLSDYYTIRLTRTGKVHEWYSDRQAAYDDAYMEKTAERIMAGSEDSGRIGTQFYRRSVRSYGTLIVVIDGTKMLEDADALLRLTAAVSAAVWVMLCAGAWILIAHMTKPVETAFEKQKQFVWDAGHELKTPMAVIATHTQVLEGEVGETESMRYIREAVRDADALVGDLLALARMDAGKQPMASERMDWGRTIRGALLPLESLAYEAGKTLVMDVEEGGCCVGDARMLARAAVILIDNAIRYSGHGGRITVRTAHSANACSLYVHNTGSFIPPEAQKRIFERFYRADPSHDRQNGGSGLGLAIARGIAQMHKGSIRVQSDEKTGTTFILTVPAERKGEKKRKTEP